MVFEVGSLVSFFGQVLSVPNSLFHSFDWTFYWPFVLVSSVDPTPSKNRPLRGRNLFFPRTLDRLELLSNSSKTGLSCGLIFPLLARAASYKGNFHSSLFTWFLAHGLRPTQALPPSLCSQSQHSCILPSASAPLPPSPHLFLLLSTQPCPSRYLVKPRSHELFGLF